MNCGTIRRSACEPGTTLGTLAACLILSGAVSRPGPCRRTESDRHRWCADLSCISTVCYSSCRDHESRASNTAGQCSSPAVGRWSVGRTSAKQSSDALGFFRGLYREGTICRGHRAASAFQFTRERSCPGPPSWGFACVGLNNVLPILTAPGRHDASRAATIGPRTFVGVHVAAGCSSARRPSRALG